MAIKAGQLKERADYQAYILEMLREENGYQVRPATYCCGICVNVIGSCFERCRYGGDAPRRLLRLSRAW